MGCKWVVNETKSSTYRSGGVDPQNGKQIKTNQNKSANKSKRISKLSSETPARSASTALLSPAGERHHIRAELLKNGL